MCHLLLFVLLVNPQQSAKQIIHSLTLFLLFVVTQVTCIFQSVTLGIYVVLPALGEFLLAMQHIFILNFYFSYIDVTASEVIQLLCHKIM